MRAENHAETLPDETDIIIIGGGLVGASLAVALKPSGKNVLLVEAVNPQSEHQPSYDERTIALTHSAKLIFSAIGVWEHIERIQAQPIWDIHISNRGHFGQTHLSCKDVGSNISSDALGYVVPARVIGNVLWGQLENHKNTRIVCPAHAQNLQQQQGFCALEIIHNEKTKHLKAKLVVVADGGRSAVSEQWHETQTDAHTIDYAQSAILSIVCSDRAHHGRAYERFTHEGPLALLPHSNALAGDARYAVVWTTDQDNVTTRMGLSDDEFIAVLQTTFGDRGGNFSKPSPRTHYPLKRMTVPDPAAERVIIIGNAAHTVHPVAGQGFNLGLRDVAELAEIIFQADFALGSGSMLATYNQARQRDTAMVTRFTHSLIEIFSNNSKVLGFIRNVGLQTLEYCPPAKRFLLKRTMGLAGRPSKLALGIPLSG